jgi:glycerophosphoryl diester phosphodiesterase
MMIGESLTVLRGALGDIAGCWKRLLVVSLAYRLLAFVVLVPLSGLILRGFLWLAGSPAVADQDIVGYLLSPVGLAALVVVSAVGLAIVVAEIACLMVVAYGQIRGQRVAAAQSLHFVLSRARAIGHLSILIVSRLLLIAAPFAVAVGGLYLLLLSEHDINFYLAEWPPIFVAAVVIAGLLVAILAVLVTRRLLVWVFTIPLVLFEGAQPHEALATSAERYGGARDVAAVTMIGWGLALSAIGGMPLLVVVTVGQWVVPWSRSTMPVLVVIMGGLLALWSLLTLIVNVAADATFAALTARLYDRSAGESEGDLRLPTTAARVGPIALSHRNLLAGLIVAAVAAAVVGVVFLDGVQTEDQVLVIAHRGASGVAPENTLAAIRAAIDQGSDYVEIDVQETRDGEVVVIHDVDLMRVGGTPLRVWGTDFEPLRQVDIGSFFAPGFADERLPSLAEVLELCRDRARVVIELKFYGFEERLEERVIEIVERLQMQDQITVMSLKYDSVRKMNSLRPDWTVGILTAVAVGDLTRREADFLAVNSGIATSAFIARAHAAGQEVWVWTVNDPVNMSRVISLGVDGVITDFPDRTRAVLVQRAEMNSAERLLLAASFWVGYEPREPPAELDLAGQ